MFLNTLIKKSTLFSLSLVLIACVNENTHQEKISHNTESQTQSTDSQPTLSQDVLHSLTNAKSAAYAEAHKYWDTGITSKMYKGNDIANEHLMNILTSTSEKVYPKSHFNGLTSQQYYLEKVDRLFKAEMEANTSDDGGTLQRFILHSKKTKIINSLIVETVKTATTEDHFKRWHAAWENASH